MIKQRLVNQRTSPSESALAIIVRPDGANTIHVPRIPRAHGERRVHIKLLVHHSSADCLGPKLPSNHTMRLVSIETRSYDDATQPCSSRILYLELSTLSVPLTHNDFILFPSPFPC
jgi:hypothetical protein